MPDPRTATRRTRIASACALAALVLTGCNDAREVASSTAPTNTHVSASPAASCSGDRAPGFAGRAVPFGTAAATGPSSALQVSAGRPTTSAVPSGRPGYRLVQVPVRAAVRTNGTFAIDGSQFVLSDPRMHRCARPAIDPLRGGFAALSVDEETTATGTVAFLVPRPVPASRLRLFYLPAPHAHAASLAWRADATAPPPAKVRPGCDGPHKSVHSNGVRRKAFGTSSKHGNAVVSSSVRADPPSRRSFRPGSGQPNDVDAIDVRLRVTAHGADAFVDRRSFIMLDAAGHACRSSATGSRGETLTSALVSKDHPRTFTIVFWAPKGAPVHGVSLVQLAGPKSRTAQAIWSAPHQTLRPAHSGKE